MFENFTVGQKITLDMGKIKNPVIGRLYTYKGYELRLVTMRDGKLYFEVEKIVKTSK